MRSRTLLRAAALVAGLSLFTAGILGGALLADDGTEVEAMQRSAGSLRARYEQTRAQRDKLRAERNQLEARLAAEKAPPVCPRPFVSTAELIGPYTVDYPCGWHVVEQPLDGGQDRPGLRPDVVLFSRLPISLGPRHGPAADLEMTDWTDDPSDEEDALQPVAAWVAEERARFRTVKEERIEAGPVPAVRLAGTYELEEPTDAVVILWEYADRSGTRHVVRVFSLAPSGEVRAALDRLVRSFQPRRR